MSIPPDPLGVAGMKAIETRYRGFRFRSRLEARWAVFFDRLGIRWAYEPQGYLVNGRPYLPDFELFLPDDQVVFAEVKSDSADLFEGEHVTLCRELANGTGRRVVLLVGVPAYRMYNQLAPNLPANSFTAVFFTDHGSKLTVADAYWFQQVVTNPETGALQFPHDDREARESFGQGLVDAVAAARSARFEHGETP
jgi:hypothetical protein